jgi:rod shape-determining protein MreC
MDFIEKDAVVDIGDVILTSGTDAIFPKGFIIGEVIAVKEDDTDGLFRSVTVKPFLNLARIEEMRISIKQNDLPIQKK